MNLGSIHANYPSPLGAPPQKIEATVHADPIFIGFRAAGKMLILFATPAMVQIRDYGRGGACQILASFPGGRTVACEQVADRLVFSIDGANVFSAPAGKDQWTLYRA